MTYNNSSPSKGREDADPRNDTARPIPLTSIAISKEANAFVDSLLALVTTNRDRPTSVVKLRRAIEAFVGDLLRIEASTPHLYGRRSFTIKSYSGCEVGSRMFQRVYESFQENGFIHVHPGNFQREDVIVASGKQTRIKATSGLLQLASNSAIRIDQIRVHFRAGRPKAPNADTLILRPTNDRESLPVDPTDQRANRIRTGVESLNEYLRSKSIEGIAFAGLKRIFRNGDQPDFAWQYFGRFHSLPGGDSYEQLPAKVRLSEIEIEGEEVVEVDISASQLTILHVLHGVPFDKSKDPYELGNIDREVIKMWFTRSLGKGSFQLSDWSPNNSTEYRRRTGRKIAKDYPIERVNAAVLERYPFLEDASAIPSLSLRLQYIESEILNEAMDTLRSTFDIPALPIHDGLIVAKSAEKRASGALANAFKSWSRNHGHEVEPRIKVDRL